MKSIAGTTVLLAYTLPFCCELSYPQEPKGTGTDLRKIQPIWGTPPTKRGFVGGLDLLKLIPKDHDKKWLESLEKVTDEDKGQLFLQFVPFFPEMSLLFDKKGQFQPEVAAKYLARLDSVKRDDYRSWLTTFDEVLEQSTQKGPVALYLLPVDHFHVKDKYDPERAKKYLQRLKSVPKDATERWRKDVDTTEATTVGAAMNIILQDQFFDEDRFNPTKYEAAIKKQTTELVKIDGQIMNNDMPDKVRKHPCKIHTMKLSKDKIYIIDLESKAFDSYLRVEDSKGKELASDDDGGEGLNSQLRFQPPMDDNYQIIATTFEGGTGAYTLRVRVKNDAK